MDIEVEQLNSTDAKSAGQTDIFVPFLLKSKSLVLQLCQNFIALVRLWLSKCWNAVCLLSLVLLCFFGFILLSSVLGRAVRAGECATADLELSHLET